MKRRTFLAMTGVASTTSLAGCGAIGGGGGTPTVAEEDIAVQVTLTESNDFEPLRVSVDEGEAVEWVNDTGGEREVRSNHNAEYSSEWSPELSAVIPSGETHAYVFENSGIYTYHDRERTWETMCGAVAVGDNTEDDIGDLVCEVDDSGFGVTV